PARRRLSPLPLHDALPIERGVGLGESAADDRGAVRVHHLGARAEAQAPAPRAGAQARIDVLVDQLEVLVEAADLFPALPAPERGDRKSTRLNSSHAKISYA